VPPAVVEVEQPTPVVEFEQPLAKKEFEKPTPVVEVEPPTNCKTEVEAVVAVAGPSPRAPIVGHLPP
jgi:hypothetical protein